MPRYTTAYSSFLSRKKEVELLQKMAFIKERNDPMKQRDEINALCRSALVLLCAHLEAFIKELGEVALDSLHSKCIPRAKLSSRIYYHISKNYIDEVQDASDPDKIGERIFAFINNDLHFWSRIGPFPQPIEVDRFNKGFSNPAYKKIKTYFNRFGYLNYSTDLARVLRSNYQTTINMVDHLVDIRNKIAHGDLTATKTPSELSEITAIIQTYCKSTDSTFAAWWKSNFCSIR